MIRRRIALPEPKHDLGIMDKSMKQADGEVAEEEIRARERNEWRPPQVMKLLNVRGIVRYCASKHLPTSGSASGPDKLLQIYATCIPNPLNGGGC